MNVLFVTEEDVFYIFEFFKAFFPLSREGSYKIKGISILPPFNKKSNWALAKQMYSFFGPFHFIVRGFLYVWKKLTGATIANLSKNCGIPKIFTANVNDPQFIQEIRKLDIDIIVSIAAPQVFKPNMLRSAKYGCINSHSALLPENRGMMPVFWSMYKGHRELGVTVHYMDEKLDHGNIIKQECVERVAESWHEMTLKTKRMSARLIHETLEEIANGTIHSYPMPEGGSYQTFPTFRDVKEFKRRGNRLF